MDVATASQLNSIRCSECASLLEGFLASHLCPNCQTPQPLRQEDTYFSALGIPVQFEQDWAIVQKRFYEISRAMHPDRFVSAQPHHRVESVNRMSFLNQAFQTLKSPVALRDYILKLYGLRDSATSLQGGGQKRGSIPMEIAEAWFELQEIVLEDPIAARQKWVEFDQELSDLKIRSEANLKALEKQFDLLPKETSPELLAVLRQMDHELQNQNYFRSIEKDVERMKSNVNSS